MQAVSRGSDADTGKNNQLFRVVYDPKCDRFFLQDEHTAHQRAAAAAEMPWDEWVLPPKSSSKKQQQQRLTTSPRRHPPVTGADTVADAVATLALEQHITLLPKASSGADAVSDFSHQLETTVAHGMQLPQLDLSSVTMLDKPQPTAAATTPSAKKARIRSYVAHFAHANVGFPQLELSSTDTERESAHEEIKWNGEPIRVKVACESSSSTYQDPVMARSSSKHVEGEGTHAQHVFELQQLQRIRPHADGFRDTNVNIDCTFTPLTSSSSSSSSSSSPSSASSVFSEDEDSLPIFQRGDRVLFRVRHRRLRGMIARRVRKSSFYDVKAANGTRFLAISALRIRLLPPDEEPVEPPLFNFQRGDRVLWLPPEQQANSSLTYKARVLRLRSLQRFDIQLRTGRVRQKIPYEELRPRAHDS